MTSKALPVLSVDQRRLLTGFVREYEQAQRNLLRAQDARDQAAERLLKAGFLALGRSDLQIDYATWEVIVPTAVDE